MSVYTDTAGLPAFKNAVLTIGTFDGVHTGHLLIIRQLLMEAEAVNGTPVLITFHPHPRQVIQSSKKPLYTLNTPEEKYHLIKKAGISNIVVVPFTIAFAEQPAITYIKDFLVDKFHPHTIIIGYDHRFGKDRAGDYRLLEDEGAKYNYKVKEIPEHVLQNVTISSTRIRESLLTGDIDTANACLGYDYFFEAMIVEGNKIGRTIGYPTANLQLTDKQKLVPGNGVYAVTVMIEGVDSIYKGMMNIGVRPTIGGTTTVIEVNIFDFSENIYDKKVTVFLKKKLRDESKFNGLEGLKEQLGKDKEQAIALFRDK